MFFTLSPTPKEVLIVGLQVSNLSAEFGADVFATIKRMTEHIVF